MLNIRSFYSISIKLHESFSIEISKGIQRKCSYYYKVVDANREVKIMHSLGHWEGDLILDVKKSSIATLVDWILKITVYDNLEPQGKRAYGRLPDVSNILMKKHFPTNRTSAFYPRLKQGYPATLRTDQGVRVLLPLRNAADYSAREPAQNGFINSFNGHFSDECNTGLMILAMLGKIIRE